MWALESGDAAPVAQTRPKVRSLLMKPLFSFKNFDAA
jgi:hypothetical protein